MNKPQVRVKDSRTIIEFNPYDFEGYPRILTTFSADTITLKELAGGDHKRLSALGEKLAEMHMYAHTDDENEEYISDMDMKIVVDDNDIFSIERDEFYLEFSVLFYTGYHWYIINEQGQRISFSDDGEFVWMENVLDKDGESDPWSEKYEFEELAECPVDCLLGKPGYYKAVYEPTFLKK